MTISALVLAALVQSACDGAPCPAPPPPPPSLPAVRARLALGVGGILGSPEESLLSLDRYGGFRTVVGVDASWLATESFGVGAWATWTMRRSKPSDLSPRLVENDWVAGVQLPIVLGDGRALWLFTPRVGYGLADLSLGSGGKSVGGVAWGGELSVSDRYAHLGVAIGAYSARTAPPGETGRAYDMGTYYIALTGTFDE